MERDGQPRQSRECALAGGGWQAGDERWQTDKTRGRRAWKIILRDLDFNSQGT